MSSKGLRASILLVAGISCILAPSLRSQPLSGSANLQVRVVHTNEHPAEAQLRVELQTGNGLAITSGFTDSNGMAFFGGLRGGGYRLRITGHDIVETLTSIFFVDSRERNHTEVVTVQSAASQSGAGPANSVAVVDLNVPKRAQKEYDKGADAFKRGDLEPARKQFESAIAAYPNYASAYNLLGMTLMRQGQAQPAQQAFEKAIELNDRFALAYTNLAKLYFAQQNLERSEALLRKSVAAEPRSSETLAILAQVELMTGKYEQAIVSARRVHDLPHQEFAIAHFVAARALRARNQRDEAMNEYKLFLQEAPNSASSAQARQELTQLENQRP
jgi:tetratricopeptide (TPR) repeat protein